MAPTVSPAPAAGRSSSTGVPLYYLLPLRVYMGYAFLRAGIAMQGAFLDGGELRSLFSRWATDNPYPFARAFLSGRAQLWSELIAYLVAWSAVAIGIALASGAFTRATALAGATLVGAALVLGGHTAATAAAQGQIYLVALLTLTAAGAGRTLGVDGWLHRRAPVMPFTLLY